jgi:prevent-host-death family protein
VNVRELARNTSKVIDDVTHRGEATLVTRDGLPVAALVPIDPDALEDWILANAPEFVEGMRLADEEMKRGETVSFDDLVKPRGKPKSKAGGRARRR